FKLEGVNQELTANHGGTGWELMCFDFTGLTGGSSATGITLIFDNGTVGAAETDPDNWTFLFDDIVLGESCGDTGGDVVDPDPVLPVDFEGDPAAFVFLEGGGFEGGQASVVANPDTDGNTSAQVGQMLKFDGAVFGGATLDLGGTANLPSGSAFTMKVWSQRPVPVLFKLEGGPVGEVTANHGGTGWEELCFDFGTLSGDGVSGITLIFDLGISGAAATDPANWTFYFDDIALASGCGDSVVDGDSPLPVDFEGDPAAFVFLEGGGFEGGQASVVANPDTDGNTSAQVGQMLKFDGAVFGGATLDLGGTANLPSGSAFTMKVWSQRPVPVLFKLEGGPVGEVTANHGGTGWEELCFDFGTLSGDGVSGITLIFDLGISGAAATDPANWTFYFDDIALASGCGDSVVDGDSPLPVDFEGDPAAFVFLEGGGFEGGQASVVANPDTDGNTSAQVGQMLKFDGAVFGGATLDLGGTANLPSGSAFTMKVWSQRPVPVLFKLEGGPVGEVTANHAGTGWEELCFDFGTLSGDGVSGITLIFDLGISGAAATDPANWTFYFDDIALAAGCGGTDGEVFGANEVNFETP
ncbi:hypothetical protein CWI75_08240, partial [Kineobactrum sediminis]